uniref:Uncharacterized protein n=1 Tax=Schistosoma mansoni TaxID=6183 RepID=A0A146MGH4_SCHMA
MIGLDETPTKAWSQLGSHHSVDIIPLTITFFVLTFLTATQDIAVDGWALTLLSKKNLGWASTCNKVGQSLGHALSFIPLVCLESPDIPNKYLRRTPIEDKGLITFFRFVYIQNIWKNYQQINFLTIQLLMKYVVLIVNLTILIKRTISH